MIRNPMIEDHGTSGCASRNVLLIRLAASPTSSRHRSMARRSARLSAKRSNVTPAVRSTTSRANSTMSASLPTSLCSGCIDDLAVGQDVVADIGVLHGVAFDEIDLSPKELFQLVLHVDDLEETPGRLLLEGHQHVHITIRAELQRLHDRAEQRQLDDPPLAREFREALVRDVNGEFHGSTSLIFVALFPMPPLPAHAVSTLLRVGLMSLRT